MSSVDFRWLPEPVALKKTELAFQDQARSPSKTGLSPPPHPAPVVLSDTRDHSWLKISSLDSCKFVSIRVKTGLPPSPFSRLMLAE